MEQEVIDLLTMPELLAEPTVGAERTRDATNFETLVRRYQPYAFSLAKRFLWNDADAEEAVQESFLRVWKHLHDYDPGQQFTTWMYTIVSRVCLDRIRSARRRRFWSAPGEAHDMLENLPDCGDLEREVENRDLAECVRKAVGTLPDKQRLVFTLRDLQDLTVEEVADISGMSHASVKTNLCYARKAIRKILLERYGIVRSET